MTQATERVSILVDRNTHCKTSKGEDGNGSSLTRKRKGEVSVSHRRGHDDRGQGTAACRARDFQFDPRNARSPRPQRAEKKRGKEETKRGSEQRPESTERFFNKKKTETGWGGWGVQPGWERYGIVRRKSIMPFTTSANQLPRKGVHSGRSVGRSLITI